MKIVVLDPVETRPSEVVTAPPDPVLHALAPPAVAEEKVLTASMPMTMPEALTAEEPLLTPKMGFAVVPQTPFVISFDIGAICCFMSDAAAEFSIALWPVPEPPARYWGD